MGFHVLKNEVSRSALLQVLTLLEVLPNRLTANFLEELRLSKQGLVRQFLSTVLVWEFRLPWVL